MEIPHRKATLSLLFLLCNGALSAQDYLPIFEEGKTISTAIMSPGSMWEGNVSTVLYTIKGDTLIDGRICKKVLQSTYESEPNIFRVKDELKYVSYEEGRQIYVKRIGKWAEDRFHLYFDYNWKKGDRVTLDNFYYQTEDLKLSNAKAVVNEVSFFETPDGRNLRQWNLTAYNTSSLQDTVHCRSVNVNFVEGIGYLDQTDFSFHFDMTGPSICRTMMCQTGTGEKLFDLGHGPIWTGISNVTTDHKVSVYYDISGKRLRQKPAKGVFLQNGKKHIGR